MACGRERLAAHDVRDHGFVANTRGKEAIIQHKHDWLPAGVNAAGERRDAVQERQVFRERDVLAKHNPVVLVVGADDLADAANKRGGVVATRHGGLAALCVCRVVEADDADKDRDI